MSVLSDIFKSGGGNVPAFNPTPLRDILNQGATTQKGIVAGLPQKLSPFSTNLQGKTNELGAGYTDTTKALSDRLTAGAVNPVATENAITAKQQQEFRSVPQQQQAIRDALASSNRLATGRGAATIAQPVINAANNTSDFASQLDLQNENQRQDALKTGVSMEQQAALSKLGLDQDTMKTLFETGRGDVVQEAADMLGIEGDLSQGLFNLENTTQQSNIAQAQADADRRAQLRNALLGIGGQLAGVGIGKLVPQRTVSAGV